MQKAPLPAGRTPTALQRDRASADVVDAAHTVFRALGAWHAAATYVEALAMELAARGHRTHRSASLSVLYRGRVVGNVEADLLVDERVLLLVRADPQLVDTARLELLRGLAASSVEVGLLLNFGARELAFVRIC